MKQMINKREKMKKITESKFKIDKTQSSQNSQSSW